MRVNYCSDENHVRSGKGKLFSERSKSSILKNKHVLEGKFFLFTGLICLVIFFFFLNVSVQSPAAPTGKCDV